MENCTKYSLKLLSNVYEAMSNNFEYDFTPRQLACLIGKQNKDIREALEKTNGDDGVSIDNMINEIAKKITGMRFPLKGAPAHHRHRFQTRFKARKNSYFMDIEKIKE